ncbi:hypothetical protein Tco_1457660, partial [Tanacetum coccineum]
TNSFSTVGSIKSYEDLFPTTCMQYNWIMRKHLEPREDPDDFMIVEDISSIIDPRLSQVVLGKPFIKISIMTYDLSLGIVKFANGTDEIAYKMPHKIEQFNLLSDLEKEQSQSTLRMRMTREEELMCCLRRTSTREVLQLPEQCT